MFIIEPNRLIFKSYIVKDDRWKQPPIKIVLLADIHMGSPFMTIERLEQIVDRINLEKPDIVLLGGDYVTSGVVGGTFIDFDDTVKVLSRLEAKLGKYAVLGNHDWWVDGQKAFKAFNKYKIPLLENSSFKIKHNDTHFWVVGIADDMSSEPNFSKAYSKISTDQPVIQISHDPASFYKTPNTTLISFAGHTHGGQVNIPFIPNISVSRAPPNWTYGYIEENNKKMIVTSGIGTSILPLRFNRPPEVVIVTLRNK